MAHAARVSELVDNLIQSLLGIDKTHPSFAKHKSVAVKGVRDNSYGRTNQFEVKDRLNGLVEKFAVLNRDDLSDALQSRLEDLPTEGKWLPEILALFLSLSDRPVEKTRHGALESLHAELHPEEQLTWAEILADDPLDEPGIWDDIERGYHSSGDETGFEDAVGSEPTTSTLATTIGDDSVEASARSYVTEPDVTLLEPIKQVRQEHGRLLDSGISRIYELAVIRESLFMLRGLPTNLYPLDTATGRIKMRPDATIATACTQSFGDSLAQFVTLGNELQLVSKWVRIDQFRPYIRTCQAGIEKLLIGFGKHIAALEERYVGNSVDVVVSLIDVLAKTQYLARHLSHIASMLNHLPSKSPFALLNVLYDSSCAAQMIGDDESFVVLSSILFEATQTYLRPVALWISNGYIPPVEHDFFVSESEVDCGLGNLWHSKYVLRLSKDNAPSTPGFMQDKAAEIFALGKSKMFLDHLNQGSLTADHTTIAKPEGPDFAGLRQQIEDSPLLPFSELFDETIRHWLSSISTDVTPNLKASLLDQHGLLRTLAAIDTSFFAADGTLFQDFADSLFERIKRTPSSWENSLLLTELARETLGESSSVDPQSLSIDLAHEPSPKPDSTTRALQTIHLSYHLPWPIQNITRQTSPQTPSKAFTLLLQVSHAQHILHSQTFTLRKLHSTTLPTTTTTTTTINNNILNPALKLRHSLLTLTTTLRSHIATVTHTLTPALATSLLTSPTIDSMLTCYTTHTHRLEVSLLLAPNLAPLREALVSALALCERASPLWELATTEGVGEGTREGVRLGLRKLQGEFEDAVNFVRAGVRGVSRAGGEVLLEGLVGALEGS